MRTAKVLVWSAIGVLLTSVPLVQAAAAPRIRWARQYGTPGYDIGKAVDVRRNERGLMIVAAGETDGRLSGSPNHGSGDAYLARFGPDGRRLWVQQFGTVGEDMANDVAIAGEAIFAVGAFHREVGVVVKSAAPAGRQPNAWVRRYSSSGRLIWEDRFGGSGWDEARSVAVDTSGVYVAGTGRMPGTEGVFGFIRKYGHDGRVRWTIGVPDPHGVAIADGLLTSCATQPKSAAGGRLVLRAFRGDGVLRWSRRISIADASCVDVAARIDRVYIGGNVPDPGGGIDVWVRAFDPSGGFVFARRWGTSGREEMLARLDACPLGVTAQSGIASSSVEIRRYSPIGASRFATVLASSTAELAGGGVAVSHDDVFTGGWIEGGHLPGQRDHGKTDAFLIRLG